MLTEIKNKHSKKTLPVESGLVRCEPLPDPGTVNSDAGGAYFMEILKTCCDCKHFRMWKPEMEYCTLKKRKVDPLTLNEKCYIKRKNIKKSYYYEN